MATLEALADSDLVQQVQRNLAGETAFAELYRRHVDRIYRYLLARVGDENDAQDLTAQTFLAALEAIPKFRGEAQFSTWLFSIARHRLMDYFRQQKPVWSLDHAEFLSDQAPTPEESASQSLQLARVTRAMHTLAKDRAEALALHSFGGLSVAEVAQIMQKNESAVRMLIHRAIQDLKLRLQEVTS